MGACSLAMGCLLLCDLLGIFHFEKTLKAVILVGGPVCLSSIILWFCKAPDNFLKYYMSIVMALLDEQHQIYLEQASKDAKYQLLIKEMKDVVFEYYPTEGRYEANRSIYAKPGEKNEPVTITAFEKSLPNFPGLKDLYDRINKGFQEKCPDDFQVDMSHEIRTPMNAIVGMTEVALRGDMEESVKQNLRMVKSSAFGLLTLINDILNFSKIEAGRFEIVKESFSILSISTNYIRYCGTGCRRKKWNNN